MITKKTNTSQHRIRSEAYRDAWLCVEWLNGAPDPAVHKRVLRIRKELEALTKMRYGLKGGGKETAALEKRSTAVNRLLSRYLYIPTVGYSALSADWRFDMVANDRPTEGLTVTFTDGLVALGRGPALAVDGESVSFVVSEADVVAALGRLMNHRQMYMVRLCTQCKARWRLSERELDRFCSEACRVAWYLNSAKHKERMRRNQQRYRDRKKQLDPA